MTRDLSWLVDRRCQRVTVDVSGTYFDLAGASLHVECPWRLVADGITERISYRIPTFELDGGYVLYIAAFKDHVSVYPVTSAMVTRYGKAIARYRVGKGTLRFPLDQPMPTGLVTRLAKVRVHEGRRAT